MLRYQKPTRIELKKADIDSFEQKRKEELQITQDSESILSSTKTEAVPPVSPKLRQIEIRRRLGFTPDVVANDSATGIHY